MLRVFQSKNAAQAKAYFSDELSHGDYYTQGQEIAGVWGGKAAEQLGLSGTVDKPSFNALIDNTYPPNDEHAGEHITEQNRETRRPGYDLTFNAPKSLSVLYEYSQDERLLDAFREAVHTTMDSIEEAMHTRVRKDGLDEDRHTGNLAYAEFVHFTARPVEGLAPDPHLHAHCYVPNLTFDETEQQWKAGQFGQIKTDAPYFEALFHSHLSQSLSDMGLEIARDGKFWTLDGLDKDTLQKFSHRSAQIEEAARERGIDTDWEKDQLAAKTRSSKTGGLARDTLRDIWWDRLDDHEKTTLDKLSEFEPVDDTQPPTFTAEETVEFSIKHQLERQSVVSFNRLKETALRQGFGDVSPAQMEEAFAHHDDLIVVDQQATTKSILLQEQQIIAFTRNGYAMHDKLNADYAIGKVHDTENESLFDLSDDQKEVVNHLLDSRHRVQAVQGKAGTGKTTTLSKLIDGIEQGGGSAFCLAPTADAAYDTLRTDGEKYQSHAMQNAHTLARFFVDEKLWQEAKGSTLIVDEAGLMSVDDMHALFALANQFDNRVVLVGDTSQHNSVLRGDAFRLLQEQAGLEPLALDAIRRQQFDYKEAVKTIAEGDLVKGFDLLDQQETITEEGDSDARYRQLAERYADIVDQGKSVLTVAPTHFEGAKVTEAIRDTLQARGMLEEQEHSTVRFKNRQLTEAQRGDGFNFETGMMVRFQQNAKGEQGRIDRGQQFTVSSVDKNNVTITDSQGQDQPLDLSQAKRFSVYEPQAINLAIGDSLRITEGHKSADGKRLNNGAIYHVKGFTDDGNITLHNGAVLDADKGNFNYGYVTTSHASQGKTVNHVLIAQDTNFDGAASAEQFYVSVSRGRESVEIFTDDKATLRDQIQRSHQRSSATELLQDKGYIEQDDKNSLDTFVAAMEFYAKQFVGQVTGVTQDFLTAFRRNDIDPENTRWQDVVSQREQEQQDRDLSL